MTLHVRYYAICEIFKRLSA